MDSSPLVLTDPNLLAEFVRESEFKTFFEKRFASPPDLAALLFRDGALINSFKGTQFSVGGLWENIKGVVGGSHHYAIMLADLKPFQVQFAVRGISKDMVEIAGTATLELQLNPDKPSNILGLMGGVSRQQPVGGQDGLPTTGRKALSRLDVLERIEPQFRDRVFEAVIGAHHADEIRGNRGLQDQIQADMMLEAERICGDIGVMVRNGSIVWAMNAVEREQLEKAEIERQQGMLDYQLDLMKREVARQGESAEVKIQSQLDLTKLQQASEDELAHMVLNSEVSFIDAREKAARRQEAEALQHEITILRTERAGKFENQLAESGQLIDLTKEKARLRVVERDIDALDRNHGAQMRKMEAFTEIEIRDRDADSKITEAQRWADQALKNLEGTGKIEQDLEDRKADRGIKVGQAETTNKISVMDAEARNRVDQLGAAAGMTPEQIMAITASYSETAATAKIEEARARAAGGEQLTQVVRDLSAEMKEERALSREHEHRMLETGMKGATGVAYGAGGKDGPPPEELGQTGTTECPKCGKSLSAKARFCNGCGHQMRT
ncbi:MAG TPA: hypothetical protein VF631_03245 [Allosphingosinicella sp.]|jgi:hypothetical protein|uniref:zinc ribbon domain-containing protein n=1 Tax=Allosphingosinicella sp. TaxID=2823234 RepID=UPI002F2A5BF0